MSTNRLITNDFLVAWNKEINPDFTVNANLGGSNQTRDYHQTFGAADELAVEGVYTIANSKVPIRSTSYQSNKTINSLYGSAQFAYKNALFLDITGRNDWSSTLPSNANSFFYPSVSVSSVLTDLLDWKSETLSYAKVRAGWAKVGSDTDPYQLAPTMSFGDGWNASTKLLNMNVPNTLPNAELKPQFANSLEFGADLKFLNNRIGLDLTYYDQKTTDQIIAIPISAASGYTSKNINAGEIDNKGFEATLNLAIIQSAKGFNWNMNVNFAKNKNKVVSLAPGVEQYELGSYWDLKVMAIPGQPYGSLYGADFLRDPNGNIINRGGVPVKGDLKILGNYQPDWIGGINNEFQYKNLTASFLIDIHHGGDLYSMTNAWGRYAGALEETLIGREGGIVGVGVKEVTDGSGNVTYVPNDVVVTAEEYNHAAFTNSIPAGSIFDASYVKLREVRVAYAFTKLGNLPIKKLNVALVGRNLAILSSTIPHVDPETSFNSGNAQGLEFGQLPSARSLGFNINMEF
jgi:outer membrane receptor protein involved in Fe transport